MGITMTGLAAGAGVALVATILTPAVGGVLKATTETAIKAGLLTYRGGKAVIDRTARCLEQVTAMFENIASEAKAELDQKRKAAL